MKTVQILLNSSAYNDVLDIRKKVFVEEQMIPLELEIDETETHATYFLTYAGTQPAATGRLRPYGKYIKFERIATLKEWRGKGVGRNLMEGMLDYALKNFPGLVPYMHSQESAVAFYERMGWRKSGDPFVEAEIPHQAMIFQN